MNASSHLLDYYNQPGRTQTKQNTLLPREGVDDSRAGNSAFPTWHGRWSATLLAVGRCSRLEADAGAGLGVARLPTLLLAISGRTRPAVEKTTPTTCEGPLATTFLTQGRGGLSGGGSGVDDSGSSGKANLNDGITRWKEMKEGSEQS